MCGPPPMVEAAQRLMPTLDLPTKMCMPTRSTHKPSWPHRGKVHERSYLLSRSSCRGTGGGRGIGAAFRAHVRRRRERRHRGQRYEYRWPGKTRQWRRTSRVSWATPHFTETLRRRRARRRGEARRRALRRHRHRREQCGDPARRLHFQGQRRELRRRHSQQSCVPFYLLAAATPSCATRPRLDAAAASGAAS